MLPLWTYKFLDMVWISGFYTSGGIFGQVSVSSRIKNKIKKYLHPSLLKIAAYYIRKVSIMNLKA